MRSNKLLCNYRKVMNEITPQELGTFIKNKESFILHFWAAWNTYDVFQKKILEQVANELPKTRIYKMDVDPEDNHQICLEHKVCGPPTVVFYFNGELQEYSVGVTDKTVIEQWLLKNA